MSLLKTTLENIAKDLNISEARYDSAERSYKSIAKWFQRPESRLAQYQVRVYLQGSFRLGTPIRPVIGEERYDLDMVCEVNLKKHEITQERFQTLAGEELIDYAKSHGMEAPERWDRCWTLNYNEEARFKIDFLPSIPDGTNQAQILNETRMLQNIYITSSIAIADRTHHNFYTYSHDWPVSNPNGFAEWFISQMNLRQTIDEHERLLNQVEIAEVPVFKRRTPLQMVIQLLKHHRDMMFRDDFNVKPSSVILTTLAGLSYKGERTIHEAILGILARMESHIKRDTQGNYILSNPSDPRENFADAWKDNVEKAENFFDWLRAAKYDFGAAESATSSAQIIEVLSPRLGRNLVEAAVPNRALALSASSNSNNLPLKLADAPHRRVPRWPLKKTFNAHIKRVTFSKNGFRTKNIQSNEAVIPNASLEFEVETNVPFPYQVYWQVVNTGNEAEQARNLRGKFDTDKFYPNTLTHREDTLYSGAHSIQCFIIQDNVCVANSQPFVVRIGDS